MYKTASGVYQDVYKDILNQLQPAYEIEDTQLVTTLKVS
jgi:hypothetical protein